MARPLRIEYEGATDQILSRDSARQAIFLGDHDREKLLTDPEDTRVRCGWELFSYCFSAQSLSSVLPHATPQPLWWDAAVAAYGNINSETAAAVDHIYGFTGRERDSECDLYYNRARYYDPAIGRWLSEDPIGFDAGDANLSRYVGNSPTNATDPSGLDDVAQFTCDFDPNDISEDLVQEIVDANLAQKSKRHPDFVVIPTVIADRVTVLVLQRTLRERPVPTHDGDFEWLPDYYSAYELVGVNHVSHIADLRIPQSTCPANLARQEVIDGNAGACAQQEKTKATLNLVTGGVFVYHAVPFGAFYDSLAERQFGEAGLSLVGDAAFFMGFGAGKMVQAGKNLNTARRLAVGAAVSKSALAGYGGLQGMNAMMDGDKVAAAGYFGEAALRLFGASRETINVLKKAPNAIGQEGHVVLGLRDQGLAETAQRIGATHFLEGDFRVGVVAAAKNPNVKISVVLDGLEGATPRLKVSNAVQDGLENGMANSFTNWELSIVSKYERLPSVDFYQNGKLIKNPFTQTGN